MGYVQSKMNTDGKVYVEDYDFDPEIMEFFRKANSGNWQINIPITIIGNKLNKFKDKQMNLIGNSIPEDEFYHNNEHIIQFFNVYQTLANEGAFKSSNRNIKISPKLEFKIMNIVKKYKPSQRAEYQKILKNRALQHFKIKTFYIKEKPDDVHGKPKTLWGYTRPLPNGKTGSIGEVPFGSGVIRSAAYETLHEAVVNTVETILLGKGFGTSLVSSGFMDLYHDQMELMPDYEKFSRYDLGYVRRFHIADFYSNGKNWIGGL